MRSPIPLIAALAALAAAPATGAGLTPHETEYKVRVSGVSGRLTTRLERQGEAFEATHVIEPTGLAGLLARGDVRERARFEDLGNGLQPLAYESRNTLREDSGAELEFDWAAARVTGMYYEEGNRQDVDAPLDASVFDRLTMQYRLMQDLAGGLTIAAPAGDGDAAAGAGEGTALAARTDYVLFDGEKIRPIVVTKIGERDIRTAAGTFATIGVQHQKEGSSRRTLLWLAPDLDYLPVLIEQYRKDKINVRATLRSYRPLESDAAD